MSQRRSTDLNPAQLEAAETLEGPLLVVAGAGTGKTHTLVHRLVRLVKSGVPPEAILLLTFTRRAADEMIARASRILEHDCGSVAGGTFHSFASRLLRRYGHIVDVERGFTILDQSDCFEIIGGIRTDMRLGAKGRRFPRRETVAAIISKAVNKQAPIEEIVESEYSQFLHEVDLLNEICSRYETYKREKHFLDFDNLLVLLARVLEDSPEARSRVHDEYRFVMVDEYQDTNVLQAKITHALAGPERNVMVVGDDAQSIYGFRGARHGNLEDFHDSFEGLRVVKLEQNYRSTQPILDVANGLMNQMSEGFRKKLFSEREPGIRPILVSAWNELEQAGWVTGEIERLHQQEGVALSEIAVLFRAGRHAFPLEVELQNLGISYVKYGGFRFMESAHIKDVLAYLRLMEFPDDDLSLMRVLQLHEGIGKVGARNVIRSVDGQPLVEALRRYEAKGKMRAALDALATLLSRLRASRGRGARPAELLAEAAEAYRPLMEMKFDDWPRRERDLSTLVELCERYKSLTSMLTALALEPPTASSEGRLAGAAPQDQLVLSTIHSAKGLEWRVVFIIQARDGYIPMLSSPFAEEDPEQLNEELRLLYVAVTRAKDGLYVVWPRETVRDRFGWPMTSRFIANLPEECFEKREAGFMP